MCKPADVHFSSPCNKLKDWISFTDLIIIIIINVFVKPHRQSYRGADDRRDIFHWKYIINVKKESEHWLCVYMCVPTKAKNCSVRWSFLPDITETAENRAAWAWFYISKTKVHGSRCPASSAMKRTVAQKSHIGLQHDESVLTLMHTAAAVAVAKIPSVYIQYRYTKNYNLVYRAVHYIWVCWKIVLCSVHVRIAKLHNSFRVQNTQPAGATSVAVHVWYCIFATDRCEIVHSGTSVSWMRLFHILGLIPSIVFIWQTQEGEGVGNWASRKTIWLRLSSYHGIACVRLVVSELCY